MNTPKTYWEDKTQEEYLHSINIFFEKIIDRMPKYILSDNDSTKEYLMNLYQQFDVLKNNLFSIDKSQFEVVLQKELDKLINDIEGNPNKDLSYVMMPTLHELIEVKYNFKVIFEEFIQKEIPVKMINWEDSSYEWEMKAKEELEKMYSNLNLKSLQVSQGSTWKEIYLWTKETHEAIIEAQTNIGLEPFHAGLNKTVNLVFNPESLRQTRGNGKMFSNEAVNTMVLTSFEKNIQRGIWQHEFAHILDNQVGVKLFKEQNPEVEKVNPCTFLSQIEMERQLKDGDMQWSSQEKVYKSQVWMIEAISDVVCGDSSDSLKEYNLKCSEEFSKKLTENFNIQFLGEQNWLYLYDYNKEKLLNSPIIKNYVDSIVEEMYESGVRNFFTNYWDKEENNKKFNTVLYEIKRILGDNYLCEDAAINFQNNLPKMSWDFFNIMKKYGYSHTNKQRYFPKSKTVVAAAQYSLNYVSPYHTRILEVFARSCENLQKPLILSTSEYFDEKEKSLINTEDFMNPQLNKNERKVFLNTLHSLVEALGMQVNKNINNLPALQETVINIAQTTYSTSSGDEKIANMLLDNATRKTMKIH